MADIKKFVTKTSLVGVGQPKRSSLMQKIHADSITIKYMSRDGLVALIQKQRQQVKTRSALNEALLQNIKQAQSMTKSLSDRTASLPEMRLLKSKRPTSPIPASKALLRALSPDTNRRSVHGFQYRSNGDTRQPLKKSAEEKAKKYERAHHPDFNSLKQALLKATMIHCRDSKGDYTLRPVLNEVLRRESHITKSVSDISENLDAVRFMRKGYRSRQDVTFNKATSEPMFSTAVTFREKPLIGRRYYVKENDRFISNMMQQIYLLERDSAMQAYPVNQFRGEEDSEIPLRGGSKFVRSEPNFRFTRNASPLTTSEYNPTLSRPKSSFNIRYGVPSNVLESRKPILDEYMQKEFIKTSQTEVEINDYIKEIENFMANKAHKNEARKDNPFGLWQADSGTISDNQKTVSEVEIPPDGNISGSA